jgi:hypothetical protein
MSTAVIQATMQLSDLLTCVYAWQKQNSANAALPYGAPQSVPTFPSTDQWFAWYLAQTVKTANMIVQPSSYVAAQASLAYAQAVYNAAVQPVVPMSLGFSISGSAITVTHGSFNSVAVTLANGPGYSVTSVAFTAQTNVINSQTAGVTYAISPTSLSAPGTVSLTVTVPSGNVPGTVPGAILIVATDSNGLANSLILDLIIA